MVQKVLIQLLNNIVNTKIRGRLKIVLCYNVKRLINSQKQIIMNINLSYIFVQGQL